VDAIKEYDMMVFIDRNQQILTLATLVKILLNRKAMDTKNSAFKKSSKS